MRRIIFVDAHGWVALKNKGDHFFSDAQKLNRMLILEKSAFVTTNFVLDETYTVLRARAGHHVAIEFGEEIRTSKMTSIIHISPELEAEAWDMFKKYNRKLNWSFTDCTSFVVMKRLQITEAFTNDHHFQQVGFIKLL